MISQDDNLNLSEKGSAVNVTDDREARPKFWIAAYTKPNSEKKAAAELTKLGIETYVPVQKQLRFWSDRKKYIEVPVIPMIIFGHIYKEDIQMIIRHSLILKILTYPGSRIPAEIPEQEIQNLQRMLTQSDISVSFEFGTFKEGDNVVITKGRLKGINGKIRSVDKDQTTIWVSVNLLGGTIMRINNCDVERINS